MITHPALPQYEEATDEQREAVERLLEAYVTANRDAGTAALSGIYAERFFFAGPAAAQPVELGVFLARIPVARAHYQSLGLVSTELELTEMAAMDPLHVLVKTTWRFSVMSHGTAHSFLGTATYVVRMAPAPRIVVQVDHQDLGALLASG